MDVQQLKQAQEQQRQLEKEILDDIRAKAELLGMMVIEASQASAPKVKRKRRTKAEIERDNATA